MKDIAFIIIKLEEGTTKLEEDTERVQFLSLLFLSDDSFFIL